MDQIFKDEKAELINSPDTDQVASGISIFNKWGINNTIDALAGGDVLKWEAVCQMDYNSVFTKLRMMVDETTYRRAYKARMEMVARQKRK